MAISAAIKEFTSTKQLYFHFFVANYQNLPYICRPNSRNTPYQGAMQSALQQEYSNQTGLKNNSKARGQANGANRGTPPRRGQIEGGEERRSEDLRRTEEEEKREFEAERRSEKERIRRSENE